MDFLFDDVYYLYLEDRGEKSVIKLQRNYEWDFELIDGVYPSVGTLFSNLEIDEIVDSLKKDFDVVQVIEESEIDDYMKSLWITHQNSHKKYIKNYFVKIN